MLRRHTTPLFSASWRRSAEATPPTPPVLQVTALAGREKNGQSLLVWQTTLLWMLQVPVSGQFALLEHVAPPSWQVPATVGQLPLEVHTVPVCTLQ